MTIKIKTVKCFPAVCKLEPWGPTIGLDWLLLFWVPQQGSCPTLDQQGGTLPHPGISDTW